MQHRRIVRAFGKTAAVTVLEFELNRGQRGQRIIDIEENVSAGNISAKNQCLRFVRVDPKTENRAAAVIVPGGKPDNAKEKEKRGRASRQREIHHSRSFGLIGLGVSFGFDGCRVGRGLGCFVGFHRRRKLSTRYRAMQTTVHRVSQESGELAVARWLQEQTGPGSRPGQSNASSGIQTTG